MVVISQGIAYSNVVAWHLYLVSGGTSRCLLAIGGWLAVLSYLIDFSPFGYVVDFSTFNRFLGVVLQGPPFFDFWGLLWGRFTGRLLGTMSPTFAFNFWADLIAF